MEAKKPVVLVLCTGNSCRSQMGEGFLRRYAGDRFDVQSAGLEPKAEVHPLAKQVMAEVGIDLSGQHPKDVKQFLGRLPVRHLIVVCGHAEEKCPRLFPGMHDHLYWPFDDPGAAGGTEEQRLEVFRRVRDQIDMQIQTWLKGLSPQAQP